MSVIEQFSKLEAGMPVFLGGDKWVRVDETLAAAFQPGDSLAVSSQTSQLLHIPAAEQKIASQAVTNAINAFEKMEAVSDEQIAQFFANFAEALADESTWSKIQEINAADVANAKARGRSTTRLEANDKLRDGMIAGLRGWMDAASRRGQILETVQHDGFRVELVGAALGVVAFVFEGRPNVLADACGVLRGGNTVVFRIGSDALQTAKAIMDLALNPALEKAGLPLGAASLVESTSHAAGWAMFSDDRLALAVARGSGQAVDTLGSLARRAGVATSLHGTGGAWIVASEQADLEKFGEAVYDSLDRKVCNTLNTCCIQRSRADELVPVFLESMERAGQRRNHNFKLHVVEGDESNVPAALFENQVSIGRTEGLNEEQQAESIARDQLGHEWEWEDSPEVTLVIVDSMDEAVSLFNEYSPQLVGSLVSESAEEHKRFYSSLNAPFIGNDFTRWVDGQYALKKPELGLSNWENGRLFGRGSILSGDSVYTVRTRYVRE
ncbi:MAG: aldehyde dehydrogenase family protein [Verrucomicrobia bacterium]|nr:aldehyde dehydrogenase family protein [Verrucomicrobiota bacterium]MDA1066977.1 aldehyde dehydrogenase family protein [Verrucomicrobiota bacterium]